MDNTRYYEIINETNDYLNNHTGTSHSSPFYIAPTSTPGYYGVYLEDMYGTVSNDTDYNDRSWYIQVSNYGVPVNPAQVEGAPPPVIPPWMVIMTPNTQQVNYRANELKVAKWEGAYRKPVNFVEVKPDFIDTDADRFYIFVSDPSGRSNGVNYAGNGKLDKLTVEVFTDSDPLFKQITLNEKPNDIGEFWSDYLLLVSNDVDDEFKVGGITDNQPGDRTFKVKLGDRVGVRFTSTAETPAVIHKYEPVRIVKTVDVNITVMTTKQIGQAGATNNPADAIPSNNHVQLWLQTAHEVYAQVGIELLPVIVYKDQPAGVELNNTGLNNLRMDDAETLALLRGLNIRSAALNDIDIIIVNYELTGNALAVAYQYKYVNALYPDLVDSAILGEDGFKLYTMAHEIGHLLTDYMDADAFNPYHYKNVDMVLLQPNLMRNGTSPTPAIMPSANQASKRIYASQHALMDQERTHIVRAYIPRS